MKREARVQVKSCDVETKLLEQYVHTKTAEIAYEGFGI